MSKIQSESNSQHNHPIPWNLRVVFSMSKIQSESNSQQVLYICADDDRLCFLCQRYNLKAIHNKFVRLAYRQLVVFSMSKIQSESNSQQGTRLWMQGSCCVFYVKDTIWKQFTTIRLLWFFGDRLCFLCQRYNLKAIHNRLLRVIHYFDVVFSMSKIQSESNSQPAVHFHAHSSSCVFYVKDTIWKQFTT